MASAHPKTVHVFVSEFATQDGLPQEKGQARGKMTGLTAIMPTRFDHVEKTLNNVQLNKICRQGKSNLVPCC